MGPREEYQALFNKRWDTADDAPLAYITWLEDARTTWTHVEDALPEHEEEYLLKLINLCPVETELESKIFHEVGYFENGRFNVGTEIRLGIDTGGIKIILWRPIPEGDE